MIAQCRVNFQDSGGELTGIQDEVAVLRDSKQSKARATSGLDASEHVPLLPKFEVFLREFEAVQGAGDGIHSLA